MDRAPGLTSGFGAAESDRTAGAQATSGGFSTGAPSADPMQDSKNMDPNANAPGNRDINSISRAADSMPQVGKVQNASADSDDVASLEAQLKKMQRQADELKARADSLEKKASELE